MSGRDDAMEILWGWIKEAEPSNRNPTLPFSFNLQSIHGEEDHRYSDAIWQLATAGILRPQGARDFILTKLGQDAIKEDVSPYASNAFLEEINKLAPRLKPDSRAYLALALECLYGVPSAAVALVRVALEIELDSLIEKFVRSQNPGNNARRRLYDRNVGTRAKEFLHQLRSRALIPDEEIHLFESDISLIRISGNQILHPSDGMPSVDSLLVRAVLHAYRSFASIASDLKERLANAAIIRTSSEA